jgi:catechol 2,3-dioxygenase-like lactoylglutathione lyase family enzyme
MKIQPLMDLVARCPVGSVASIGAPSVASWQRRVRVLSRSVRCGHNAAVIDHVSIQCGDVAASAAFYDAVLAPLGGRRLLDFGDVIGFGVEPKPDFWLGPRRTGEGFRESHLAFEAPDRAAVGAWFEAAVNAGAEVLHQPRVWREYHPDYYGAFVRDPDGNNVEAVCHTPA